MQKLIRTISCGLLTVSLLTPGVASAAGGLLPYNDISKHWARKAIIQGVQLGLFEAGPNVPKFYPNRDMTRAEFLVMIDRLYYGGQYQIYPLTFLSEHSEWARAEGFQEPYLPYKDVDRLTWMYKPTLRISTILDRLYGPNAIQYIFPGEMMKPNQPITKEEAAKILQMFTMSPDSKNAWEEVRSWGWLEGEKTERVKRGDAAVAADRMVNYFLQDGIMPLLDYDGKKFPMVPDLEEVLPLFATYADPKTTEEQIYVDAAAAIRSRNDSEETFEQLRKLADDSFPNQVGVHYLLSWNPETPIETNLEEAFLSIDAYFEDKIILPERLGLLSANVYDIALQLGNKDQSQYQKVLDRLSAYEQKVKQDSKEWESLAMYLGALEIRSGQVDLALARYKRFADRSPEALLNTSYYYLQEGRMQEAEEVLAAMKPKASDSRMNQLHKMLRQEFASLKDQPAIISDLGYSLRQLDNADTYQVKGEAALSGLTFSYTQDVNKEKQISRISGSYQSPQKLISDKLLSYTDGKTNTQYSYDTDRQTWDKSRTDKVDFLHEWVGAVKVADRAKELHARYYKQSYGKYDVITEWIPGSMLVEKSKKVTLGQGKVKEVPLFMNKYYIDRASDQIVKHTWRYEEIYEGDGYVAYSGTDNYDFTRNVAFLIPDDVRKGVAP
ncbi:S-layer homology domain-containing protein [Brevibacillus brevis]|uniref:S-layer homology domain-containing protein n=1 Tax=Brevibacillus brevis TaxID=1393 RepID=UPI0025A660EA|nr:S-layer homology domain-containing protein [Brevibacillus brevis]WJQ83672.1 S-layer homology domain-containing protein [Brevibacillus brevis]